MLFLEILIPTLLFFVAFLLYREFKGPKTDGEIVVSYSADGKTLFSLELDRDPNTITQSKYIVFRVVDGDPAE